MVSNHVIIHEKRNKGDDCLEGACHPDKRPIWWTFDTHFSKNHEWFEELHQTLEREFYQVSKYTSSRLKKKTEKKRETRLF